MGDDRFKAHADDLFAIGMASVSRAGTVADMFLGIYRDTYPLAEVRRRARAARSVTHESAGDS
ncbi:MAG TPA: hypothetical protein VFR11_00995 [Micromonosporaceae bacterium]|nr:hypothetical protein [Micromonosporaceae bacterium]